MILPLLHVHSDIQTSYGMPNPSASQLQSLSVDTLRAEVGGLELLTSQAQYTLKDGALSIKNFQFVIDKKYVQLLLVLSQSLLSLTDDNYIGKRFQSGTRGSSCEFVMYT